MQAFFEKMTETEARCQNPVTLAFLGDAVYSLFVREKLVRQGGGNAAEFQTTAAKIVSAQGQSVLLEKILPLLNEAETDVYKRGRNAKKPTKSKSASAADYTRSTGFEAVIGYLYLTGNTARIMELLAVDASENYQLERKVKEFKP